MWPFWKGISRVEVTAVAMMVKLVLVRWLRAWTKLGLMGCESVRIFFKIFG